MVDGRETEKMLMHRCLPRSLDFDQSSVLIAEVFLTDLHGQCRQEIVAISTLAPRGPFCIHTQPSHIYIARLRYYDRRARPSTIIEH